MDRVTEIVERAINIAELVKQKDAHRFPDALALLFKIAEELRANAAEHPAALRIDEYLERHQYYGSSLY